MRQLYCVKLHMSKAAGAQDSSCTLKVAKTMVATMPARMRLMASCRTSCLSWPDSTAGAGLLATNLIAAHTYTLYLSHLSQTSSLIISICNARILWLMLHLERLHRWLQASQQRNWQLLMLKPYKQDMCVEKGLSTKHNSSVTAALHDIYMGDKAPLWAQLHKQVYMMQCHMYLNASWKVLHDAESGSGQKPAQCH